MHLQIYTVENQYIITLIYFTDEAEPGNPAEVTTSPLASAPPSQTHVPNGILKSVSVEETKSSSRSAISILIRRQKSSETVAKRSKSTPRQRIVSFTFPEDEEDPAPEASRPLVSGLESSTRKSRSRSRTKVKKDDSSRSRSEGAEHRIPQKGDLDSGSSHGSTNSASIHGVSDMVSADGIHGTAVRYNENPIDVGYNERPVDVGFDQNSVHLGHNEKPVDVGFNENPVDVGTLADGVPNVNQLCVKCGEAHLDMNARGVCEKCRTVKKHVPSPFRRQSAARKCKRQQSRRASLQNGLSESDMSELSEMTSESCPSGKCLSGPCTCSVLDDSLDVSSVSSASSRLTTDSLSQICATNTTMVTHDHAGSPDISTCVSVIAFHKPYPYAEQQSSTRSHLLSSHTTPTTEQSCPDQSRTQVTALNHNQSDAVHEMANVEKDPLYIPNHDDAPKYVNHPVTESSDLEKNSSSPSHGQNQLDSVGYFPYSPSSGLGNHLDHVDNHISSSIYSNADLAQPVQDHKDIDSSIQSAYKQTEQLCDAKASPDMYVSSIGSAFTTDDIVSTKNAFNSLPRHRKPKDIFNFNSLPRTSGILPRTNGSAPRINIIVTQSTGAMLPRVSDTLPRTGTRHNPLIIQDDFEHTETVLHPTSEKRQTPLNHITDKIDFLKRLNGLVSHSSTTSSNHDDFSSSDEELDDSCPLPTSEICSTFMRRFRGSLESCRSERSSVSSKTSDLSSMSHGSSSRRSGSIRSRRRTCYKGQSAVYV